ncbi:alkylhydroperoxidase domain protein [Corynebacterium lizhenjunii]|uniref:alkylhydroperoxidase domain protein n=1 Tax=Corynebacterium lizhenjunii TaxID=2709394 RepID=UPI0013EAC0D9|nr:alkylhydroperoxidase domain protein [Corynebacterium lizhenjunii]
MAHTEQPDIIDQLSGASAQVAALRRRRPDAVDNAQESFRALLEPEQPGDFTYAQRYAVAAFVAGIYQAVNARTFYADLLADEAEPSLVEAVDTAIARGQAHGPHIGGGYTTFADLADESALGPRLAAAFDFAHLLAFHPMDATPAAIGHLQQAGWSDDDLVSLAQLISFLSFQLRVIHGLAVLGGQDPQSAHQQAPAPGEPQPQWQPGPRTLEPDVVAPQGFVNHSLGWRPWVAPLPKEEFTPAHTAALIRPERIGSEYFRLLARDPNALAARTRTDLDIFYNTDGGLGRAERELAATVVSRLNGCEFCASVHQARSKEEGGDAAAIDRLLDQGVDADLGSPLWGVLRDASRELTKSPFAFNSGCVAKLRAVGCEDLDIIDLINSAAFFNWANRLMLTLGAPDVPKRFRESR